MTREQDLQKLESTIDYLERVTRWMCAPGIRQKITDAYVSIHRLRKDSYDEVKP